VRGIWEGKSGIGEMDRDDPGQKEALEYTGSPTGTHLLFFSRETSSKEKEAMTKLESIMKAI